MEKSSEMRSALSLSGKVNSSRISLCCNIELKKSIGIVFLLGLSLYLRGIDPLSSFSSFL
jgi:hypothetical protein